MNYNPGTDRIEVSIADAKRAHAYLLHALKQIRIAGGRPLDKHERPGAMDAFDHAGKSIVDAAKTLGISLGAEWPEEIDLRNVG